MVTRSRGAVVAVVLAACSSPGAPEPPSVTPAPPVIVDAAAPPPPARFRVVRCGHPRAQAIGSAEPVIDPVRVSFAGFSADVPSVPAAGAWFCALGVHDGPADQPPAVEFPGRRDLVLLDPIAGPAGADDPDQLITASVWSEEWERTLKFRAERLRQRVRGTPSRRDLECGKLLPLRPDPDLLRDQVDRLARRFLATGSGEQLDADAGAQPSGDNQVHYLTRIRELCAGAVEPPAGGR